MSGTGPAAPAEPRAPRAFWALSITAFASMASMRFCDALLPALASDFDTTPAVAAQVISAFAVAYGLLQLFYGPMADRFGKLRIVSFAALGCTVWSLAAALAPSLGWLTVARLLSGAAAAGIIPLTMAWIGDNVPYERRQEVLAQLLGATTFGLIVGQWAGGLVADTIGWRAGFVGFALLFAAGAVFLGIEQWRRPVSLEPPVHASMIERTKSVIAIPWARTVLMLTFCEGALSISVIAFVPSHLHLHLGVSMPIAGAILALYGAGGLLYSWRARGLVRALGESRLAATGAGCLALGFGVLAWMPQWQWSLPGCLLGGFGFYCLHNTLQTNATQMAPLVRGTAVSLFACSLFLGQSVGVLGAAWLVARYSAIPVFAIGALGLLAVGACFARLLSARRARGAGAEA